MPTATAGSGLEREIDFLSHRHPALAVTTCYLDVYGAHRPRRSDCLTAFGVLAQEMRQCAAVEEPAVRTAVEADLATLRRWLEEKFERARHRGLVLVACSVESWIEVIELPVRVQDQIVAAQRPNLLQLEAILARAKRFGVALVDHEKMRVFEFRLGRLSESPALFEGTAPHRDHQHGWNVSGARSASGDAAARWVPAGTHVDRHEVALADRHLARCASALSRHLDTHPVDHLLLGGPTPERTRLERDIPDRHRSLVAGHVAVRVNASPAEIEAAIAAVVDDVEKRDEEAILSELVSAFGEGTSILGLKAVLEALSRGRVRKLLISTGVPGRPGALCTSCRALLPAQAACDGCGAPAVPVHDIVEAAVERALRTGAECRFIPADRVGAVAELAAIARY